MSSPVSRVVSLLGGAREVVLVVPEGATPTAPRVAPVLAALDAPGRRVRLQHAARAAVLHDALAGHGHADAVVDLARGRAASRRLPVLVAHLRRGGVLAMAVPRRPQAREPLLAAVDDLRRLRAEGVVPPARLHDHRPPDERDRHALAASIDHLEVDDDLLVLRVAVETWSVVPERRFDDLLRRAPSLGRVVTSREPERRESSAPFRSSRPGEPSVAHDARRLSLRSYDDVVVAPRMVAHTHDLVLPQTFRNTEHRRPHTPVLVDWTAWSVRVPPGLGVDDPPPDRLAGTWFHADSYKRGHFGHALTEQLSQLWAWPEVLARHPDAGVLVTAHDRPVAGWELDLLEAAGVPRDRVHAAPRPVRVEHLLAATPGYVILRHIHPSLRGLYAAVGDALEARSSLATTPRRVFVTRSDKRLCHEAAQVEALAERHGFTVVAPEQHPLPDQVAMLRRAEAVAGYGGSGLFHLLLGGPPRPVVVVSHERYHVWNEKAIASLWDLPLTVVRGTPDVTTEHFSEKAMHSDYHLDLDAEGLLLRRALAELG